MKNSYCRLTSQGALCHIVFPAGANTPGVRGAFRADTHLSTHRPVPAGSGSPGEAGPSPEAPLPRSGSVPRDDPGRARRAGPPACGPREPAAGRREGAGPAPWGGGGSARQCGKS